MNFDTGLGRRLARRRLEKYDIPWKQVETALNKILAETSVCLGIDRHWRWKYHYFEPRLDTDRTTFVFRAKHRNLPYDVAVKYFHKMRGGTRSLDQAEFAVLEELHDKLDPSHRSIVAKPLVATKLGFACEWVDLPTMKTVLWTGGFSTSTRRKSIEMAATNLKLMQNALGANLQPLDSNVLLKRAGNPGGTSEAWKSAMEKYVELSRTFDGKVMRHAIFHADYTPGNLFQGGNRCVISDFGRLHGRGPAYSDGALFLMYVIAYCTFGSSGTVRKTVESDIRTFTRAYGAQQASDFQDFTYVYMASILRRWGGHEARARDAGRTSILKVYNRLSAKRLELAFAEVLRLNG